MHTFQLKSPFIHSLLCSSLVSLSCPCAEFLFLSLLSLSPFTLSERDKEFWKRTSHGSSQTLDRSGGTTQVVGDNVGSKDKVESEEQKVQNTKRDRERESQDRDSTKTEYLASIQLILVSILWLCLHPNTMTFQPMS